MQAHPTIAARALNKTSERRGLDEGSGFARSVVN